MHMNIVCATDNNYVRHCAVMLLSLRESCPNSELNVYILLSNKTKSRERSKLYQCLKSFLDSVTYIQIDPSLFKEFPAYTFAPVKNMPSTTHYRLLIPEVIPKSISKILYLDCDLLVLNDLSTLYATDIIKYPLAAVPDMLGKHKKQERKCMQETP